MATIPQRTISQFKSKLIGGGARPNLFEVQVNFPDGVDLNIQNDGGGEFDGDRFRFLCKAAQLPASNVGTLEVPFRGRVLKIAGDRTFEPWTITIMNDSGFKLRTAFETWASSIQAYAENYTAAAGLGDSSDNSGYFADMEVHQLSRGLKDGEEPKVTKSYKFYNIFPSNIAAIDLDYGNNDAVEEFTVEMQVQYWTPIG